MLCSAMAKHEKAVWVLYYGDGFDDGSGPMLHNIELYSKIVEIVALISRLRKKALMPRPRGRTTKSDGAFNI